MLNEEAGSSAQAEEYYTSVQEEFDYKALLEDDSKAVRRPIIISVFFYGTINIVLAVLLTFLSQSWYNGLAFIIYTGVDMISGIVACIGPYTKQDLALYGGLNCASLMSCCSGNDGIMRVSRWRVQKLWLFVIAFLLWLRPYALYMSILGLNGGLGISFINHNSCTRDPTDAFSVYHPDGTFGTGEFIRYDRTQAYTFCTLDGRWQFPLYPNQFVRGYKRLTNSFAINCAQQENPGFVALGNDPQSDPFSYQQCEDSYPNPAFGVKGPVAIGTLNVSTALCPGNSNAPVCYKSDGTPFTCTTLTNTVDFPHSVGMPLKVCSVCLNYWRQRSGVKTGPVDYAHCARYSETSPMPISCAFCPGRGDQGWLSDEKYSQDDLVLAFWLATTVVFINPFLEFISIIWMWHDLRKKLRAKENETKSE